jgi:hypothetical protein
MPPVERFVCRFAAEPPQAGPPEAAWAGRLEDEFRAACERIETEGEDLGETGELRFFPDRTWGGRTYVPVTAPTSTGLELFGFVSFIPGVPDPHGFAASADFTDQTADRNPEWQVDLSDEVIGTWRGDGGRAAEMTLVWGVPLVAGGRVATAELAGLAVDQCVLVDDRFTLVAPDDYRSDLLEVKLFDRTGRELARESLYEDDSE